MSDLVLSNLTINGRPVGLFYPEPPGPSFDSVTIGTQTWMSKNLNIDDGGEGIIHFDDVTAEGYNLGTQYYYTRDAALRISNTIPGWHLPSQSEWETLISYIGLNAGAKLKSTYGWFYHGNGTDDYGFTVLPTGWISNSELVGNRISTMMGMDNNSLAMYFVYSSSSISIQPSSYSSIRLIKDT
jgi:uncharacterized protein (TIGR02145 family)